jgi:hypothetical protein
VKRIQQTYGANRLQVVLLSTDLSYGMSKEEAGRRDAERLKPQQVDWPNVLVPGGFDGTQRRFNLDGYGLTLVGPDGIVRGVDLRTDDVESLLGRMFKS